MSDKSKYLVDEIVHKFDTEENSYFKLGSITGEVDEKGKDKIEHTVTIIIPKSKINLFFEQFKTAVNYVEPKNIVEENQQKSEQCYNEYMAMGSTNITSDYDLTIKGSTSNNVMWKMFVKFIDLYGVTLPYAFDTNLYSSPLHLYTQPECLNVTAAKKDHFINSNLKNQKYYLEYDKKNFTFVPSSKDEIDMELQFAFLKLSEADPDLKTSTQYSKIKTYIDKAIQLGLNKNYVFATEFEKLDKLQQINTIAMISPVTNEEKQKVLETITNDDKTEILSNIIEFYLHDRNSNKISIN